MTRKPVGFLRPSIFLFLPRNRAWPQLRGRGSAWRFPLSSTVCLAFFAGNLWFRLWRFRVVDRLSCFPSASSFTPLSLRTTTGSLCPAAFFLCLCVLLREAFGAVPACFLCRVFLSSRSCFRLSPHCLFSSERRHCAFSSLPKAYHALRSRGGTTRRFCIAKRPLAWLQAFFFEAFLFSCVSQVFSSTFSAS